MFPIFIFRPRVQPAAAKALVHTPAPSATTPLRVPGQTVLPFPEEYCERVVSAWLGKAAVPPLVPPATNACDNEKISPSHNRNLFDYPLSSRWSWMKLLMDLAPQPPPRYPSYKSRYDREVSIRPKSRTNQFILKGELDNNLDLYLSL